MFQRVIWAVDPVDIDLNAERATISTLKAILGPSHSTLYPVVLAPPSGGYRTDDGFSINELGRKFLAKAGFSTSQPLKTIELPDLSLSGAVRLLVNWAEDIRADLIVVSSRLKDRSTRLLLGSFSEELILFSSIPVLVVPAETPLRKTIKKIFFPADFSEESTHAVTQVLNLAQSVGARVTFWHHMPFHLGNPKLSRQLQDVIREDKVSREKSGKDLLLLAHEFGVDAEFALQVDKRSTVEMIMQYQKDGNFDIIAMISHSEPGILEVLGSTTRQILHLSDCSVWVLHPTHSGKRRKR